MFFTNEAEIGERFSTALSVLGLKNKEISEVFGVSSQQVSNLKKADKINDLISRICLFHKININWILSGSGEMLIKEHSINQSNATFDKQSTGVDMSNCKKMDFETVLSNLMRYYQVNTISALAKELDIAQSAISGWRGRNSIGALVAKIAEINPDALPHLFPAQTYSFGEEPPQQLSAEAQKLESLLDESNKHLLLSFLYDNNNNQLQIKNKLLKLIQEQEIK